MIKVNILWNFDTVGGGGNQFLRTLRRYFISMGYYVDDPHKADVVLVNSKDCLEEAAIVKRTSGNKFVHRIDGIFSIYRGEHERFNDIKVYDFSKNFADGVIFQSEWSKRASEKNGMISHPLKTIIFNCADNEYFAKRREKRERNGKINLVTSSWSNNVKKGFGVYKYLDENLDFNRFDYFFAGRSPFLFKNIKMRGILSSKDLSDVLNSSDIFITASEDDTCSNSLIEGLTCGLPAVVLDSGGSPEIVRLTGNGGVIFEGNADVIESINEVACNLDSYIEKIVPPRLDDIGQQYYDFMKRAYES
ncbi:MAG: glycosyltransferase [Synergistaceae bacterium]